MCEKFAMGSCSEYMENCNKSVRKEQIIEKNGQKIENLFHMRYPNDQRNIF